MSTVPFYTRSEFFEEEMASTFGKEKSADTHFCQWLVSVSLHSTLQGDFNQKYRFQVILPRALAGI